MKGVLVCCKFLCAEYMLVTLRTMKSSRASLFWNRGKLLHVWVAFPPFTLHLFVSSCTSGLSPSEKLPGDQSISEHEPHGQHQLFQPHFRVGLAWLSTPSGARRVRHGDDRPGA